MKLIDFSLAQKLNVGKVKLKLPVCASEYAAPEILDHKCLGSYTDMWSIGVFVYFLCVNFITFIRRNRLRLESKVEFLFHFRLSGYYPFSAENIYELEENVKKCRWEFDEYKFTNISNEAKDFIRRLLIKNKR